MQKLCAFEERERCRRQKQLAEEFACHTAEVKRSRCKVIAWCEHNAHVLCSTFCWNYQCRHIHICRQRPYV